MAKTFYTERDIEDLARQGVRSLVVNEGVVLTELAVEKARRLGISLVREHDTPPSAPVRPYLSAASAPAPAAPQPPAPSKDELRRRVQAAVLARLGGEVDPALLDTIIRRVLDNLGPL